MWKKFVRFSNDQPDRIYEPVTDEEASGTVEMEENEVWEVLVRNPTLVIIHLRDEPRHLLVMWKED